MSETAQAPATQSKSYELNEPTFDVVFDVDFGAKGVLPVMHRLKRPTMAQQQEYKKRSVVAERVTAGGDITSENQAITAARLWLYDEIAVAIHGYPFFSEKGWMDLTDELRTKMRAAHKELALSALLDCESEVAPEASEVTFDGGTWVVRWSRGPIGHPFLVLLLTMREWDEQQRRQFEKNGSFSSSKVEGKTRKITSGVNQAAFSALFDSLLVGASVDPLSPTEVVTVNGQPLGEVPPAAVASALLGDWKIDVMIELVRKWRGK